MPRPGCAAQVVFEEFGFQSFVARPAPFFSIRRAAQLRPDNAAARAFTGVVLDAGFSFTHAVPVFNGRLLEGGVRRLNLGGKALTNYMKELVTYRRVAAGEEAGQFGAWAGQRRERGRTC